MGVCGCRNRKESEKTTREADQNPLEEINTFPNANLQKHPIFDSELNNSEHDAACDFKEDSVSNVRIDHKIDEEIVESVDVDHSDKENLDDCDLRNSKQLSSSTESIEVDVALINLIKSCNREHSRFFCDETKNEGEFNFVRKDSSNCRNQSFARDQKVNFEVRPKTKTSREAETEHPNGHPR
ncbi:hypothetical protein ACOME3_000558 [Neoechinorhynchus agilis]